MKTGVYFLFKKRELVYIGKTEQWPVRLNGHRDLDFTSARLIECSPDILAKTERRLISYFNPRMNHMHTPRSNSQRMTDSWIASNVDLISKTIKGKVSQKELFTKAASELGYSPRYATTDFMSTITFRYNKLQKQT